MVMCLRSTVARHQCIPRWIGIWYIKIDHQQLSNVYYNWINDKSMILIIVLNGSYVGSK